MPMNYPRLNEFPEWFVVSPSGLYQVQVGTDKHVRSGGELMQGIDVSLEAAGDVSIQVSPIGGPPYGIR